MFIHFLTFYCCVYPSACLSVCHSFHSLCVCWIIKSGFIIRIPVGSKSSFSYHLRSIPEFPSNIFSFTGTCVAAFHTLNHSVSSPLFSLHYSLFFLFFFVSRICHMTEYLNRSTTATERPKSIITLHSFSKRHSFQPASWWGRLKRARAVADVSSLIK